MSRKGEFFTRNKPCGYEEGAEIFLVTLDLLIFTKYDLSESTHSDIIVLGFENGSKERVKWTDCHQKRLC